MSRRRRRKQQRQAIVNFSLAIAAVGLIGFTIWSLQPEPYDERTLCVVSDELPAHTAVIIDKTDEYTEIQAQLIADVIRRVGDQLDVGEKLTLFELDENGRFDPRGEFSLCNPGRGKQVNPLFRNPKQIEERYAARFEGPLTAALGDLIEPKEAPASPILEALARLSQTEAFSPEAPTRRLIIISDMLQNSDIFTIYGGGGDLPETMPEPLDVAERIEGRFGRGLGGVEIEVRLIPRDRYVDIQRGALKDYWNDVLSYLGARTKWRDL